MISIYFNLKTSFQVFQNYPSLPKIRTNQPIFVMAQQLERDSFMQLIRQTLSRDEYKEKVTSLFLSALIENEEINFLTCEKRGISTKDECTQTDITNEEGQHISENYNVLKSNMEHNNEYIVPRKKNDYQRGCFPRTQSPNNMQHYSFDPYCSRFLLDSEETSLDEQRERSSSSSRSTTTSRSSSGSRRSSRSRSVRSRSRTSSRSPRRRRRASPSFMESRRITSARKMPVPYTRTRPERENY